MCTTIKTKHHGCGHTQYQNTTHCHLVRRLISSAPYLPSSSEAGGERNENRYIEEPTYPSQGYQHGGLQQQLRPPPSSSNQSSTSRVPPHPQIRSRDDHRLLLQSTKWLPDSQPRVPPGLFECTQNVATRLVAGLCRQCQKQQQREQQSRNVTPRPETITPVAAITPQSQQQPSPQIQGKKEGRSKLQKKDRKGEPSSLLNTPMATPTNATSSPPSAAAGPSSGNRLRSSSTTPAAQLTVEKSPSRSLTPVSMFRRAAQSRKRGPVVIARSGLDASHTRQLPDAVYHAHESMGID
ncbi:hypothetical protein PGQ11_008868 [Apiospora arundinis]|uniref:Uncharacterized protein n=1 Tax=Apiospora arundinis TaxID=335852 RepID=A0ABR2IH77_9PEZI